jgi:hypothetical protein
MKKKKKRKYLSKMSPSVLINPKTLKVETENAQAMVEGFWKNDQLHYVSIFAANERSWSLKPKKHRTRPKLLSTKKDKPRTEFPLSKIGEILQKSNYQHTAKYLVILDTIYHIENNIELWKLLCTNGIFDIWKPEAPFNMVKVGTDPMILLLRIYQIDDDFTDELADKTFYHAVEPRRVDILEPILSNDAFRKLKEGLTSSLHEWLLDLEPIHDTCQQVYANLDFQTPRKDPASRKKKKKKAKSYGKNWKGRGESEEHKRLKEYMKEHPELVGLPKNAAPGVIEYEFNSADRSDVLFKLKNNWISLEVKASNANDDEIHRGIFQCVKYKALIRAEQKIDGKLPIGKAFLVCENVIPHELKEIATILGVKVFDDIVPQ